MLVGYIDRRDRLVVTLATTPGPSAVRRAHSFEPDHDHDTELLQKIWAQSGRRLRYLGEWHSHRWGHVRPSPGDRAVMRKIAKYPAASLASPLSAIVSRRPWGRLGWAIHGVDSSGELAQINSVVLGSYQLASDGNGGSS